MATLWVVRKKHLDDPLSAALDSLRQAYIARLAKEHDLTVDYRPYEDEWVDMAVTGPVGNIAEVIRQAFDRAGLAGFTVDLDDNEEREELENLNQICSPVDIVD